MVKFRCQVKCILSLKKINTALKKLHPDQIGDCGLALRELVDVFGVGAF